MIHSSILDQDMLDFVSDNIVNKTSLDKFKAEDDMNEVDLNKQIQDYILTFLGAPCVNVNLTDKQINVAIESAKISVQAHIGIDHKSYMHGLQLLALCNAKEILGRIQFESRNVRQQRIGLKLLNESSVEKRDILHQLSVLSHS